MSNTEQDRTYVAGGEDEVKYEAAKTGAAKSELKQTVSSAGTGRVAGEKAGFEMGREGLPTGEGTSAGNDVADPHPSTEEDYDKIPHPGGTKTPKQPDIGSNSYAHDGKAPPRSNSKGSGPQ